LEQNGPLDGKYFIIRHAESFYNLACNNEKAGTNRGLHPEEDPTLIDCSITPLGI
jgi:hypothetical protein